MQSEQVRMRCVVCTKELRTSSKNAIIKMKGHYQTNHPDHPFNTQHIDGAFGWVWSHEWELMNELSLS